MNNLHPVAMLQTWNYKRRCRGLHLPWVTLTWEVKDKDGRVIDRIEKPCHSYVQGMVDWIWDNNDGQFTLTAMKDTSGANNANTATYWKYNAPSTNANYGILVGIGNNAVVIGDYALQTKIAHGNNPTQLSYGAVSVSALATVGSTRKFTIARPFTNNSGGDITVLEVCFVIATSNPFYYMMERSLSTRLIANGATGTATYTIGTTV